MTRNPKVSLKWAVGCLVAGMALPAGRAVADSVWLQSGSGKPVELKDVKVQGVDGANLSFATASGNTTSRPLDHIPQIKLDDEPVFSAAEDAFAKGDWATSADSYRKAMAATSKDWIKDRSSMRLVEAADKSGNFNDAVAGFLSLMKTKPALATDHKPSIPKGRPDLLDPAIAQVKQASLDQKLSADQKTVLLNYLLDLYSAKGDTAGAQAIVQQLGKVAPADANSPEARKIQADSKIAQAKQLLQQKQYAQASQMLEGSGSLFTDPLQQADALYFIAEAKAGAARPDDPDQLKDAALAYMRVVALYKDTEGKPHVADALFNTARIEEQLKNPKEALALYNQIVAEFKSSPVTAAAQQNAQRLGASAGTPKGT